MGEVWDRQDWETSKRYKCFAVYRDMGILRSLNKLCDQLGKPRTYRRQLEKFCSEGKWVDRCDAFDSWQEEQRRKENEQEIREMNKRHIQQSLMMQKNSLARLQNLNPQEMSLSDCVRMLEVATKIERQSRDCDTPKMEINNKVVIDTKEVAEQKRLANLSAEELEEFERLMKKIDRKDAEND